MGTPDHTLALGAAGVDRAGIVTVIAAWEHAGRAADLVRELKYGRATSVVTELASRLAELAPAADLVTWVPASPGRRRQRGFDQSELLARAVGHRCRTPARRLLRRVDDEPQTSRDLDGRRMGPTLAPAGRRLRFKPTVLLVDDVTTTGATLTSAAGALRDGGAGRVIGLVVTVANVDAAVRHEVASASIVGNTQPLEVD